MADESSDISNVQQFAICIRWVDNVLEPHEDFIGLHAVEIANAKNLSLILKVCDSLSLACRDTVRNCTLKKNLLNTSFEITKLVKFSPKRESHLKEIIAEDMSTEFINKTIRSFSQTRWTVRAKSLQSIFTFSKKLKNLWDWCLSEYGEPDISALSATLQTPNISAAEAQKLSRSTTGTIVSLQEEAQFNKFWGATIVEVDNPKLPRKGKAPQRIEECFTGNANPEFHSDIQSHYRQIYYETLDFVTSAIQKRFEKPDYQIYVNLENLLLKAANKEDFSEEQKLVTAFYDTDFDTQRLKVHVEILGEDCTK